MPTLAGLRAILNGPAWGWIAGVPSLTRTPIWTTLKAFFKYGQLAALGETSDHQSNHTNTTHGLAMIEPDLIIAAESSRLEKPAKRSLTVHRLERTMKPLA